MRRSTAAAAALLVALLGLHLAVRGGDEPGPRPPTTRSSAATAPMEERRARDLERKREFHESRQPAFGDASSEREAKDLDRNLRKVGNAPVENVGGEFGGRDIPVIGVALEDLRAVLDAGGSYSGPLPDDVAAEVYGGGR